MCYVTTSACRFAQAGLTVPCMVIRVRTRVKRSDRVVVAIGNVAQARTTRRCGWLWPGSPLPQVLHRSKSAHCVQRIPVPTSISSPHELHVVAKPGAYMERIHGETKCSYKALRLGNKGMDDTGACLGAQTSLVVTHTGRLWR